MLKNALDLMGFDEFEGKMIGLVGVSGGAMGAFEALNSLRNIGRALHAWVVPEQAAVPEAGRYSNASGAIRGREGGRAFEGRRPAGGSFRAAAQMCGGDRNF